MRAFGILGALFISFVHWLFKKSGINGILIIILFIEIPILCFYYSDSSRYYAIDDNYRIEKIVDYEEIFMNGLPETENEPSPYHYFYTTVQIDNYYYKEIPTPDLKAEDSDGISIPFSQCGYYDDLENNASYTGHLSAVIPAGVSANVPYLLELSDYHLNAMDSITIYGYWNHLHYDSEKQEYEAGRRLTAPLAP